MFVNDRYLSVDFSGTFNAPPLPPAKAGMPRFAVSTNGDLSIDDRDFKFRLCFAEDGLLDMAIDRRRGASSADNPESDDDYLPRYTVEDSCHEGDGGLPPPSYAEELRRLALADADPGIPKMNVVIMAVGAASEVQLFLDLAHHLQTEHGPRVRLVTHAKFKPLCVERQIEFRNIDGRYTGTIDGLLVGDPLTPRDRSAYKMALDEILDPCWQACVEPSREPSSLRGRVRKMWGSSKGRGGGGGDGNHYGDDEEQQHQQQHQQGEPRPFIADAIIANPLSLAHVHCAEALGIPLHIMSRTPWTPTRAFPHPLARVVRSNISDGASNLLSYALMDTMLWFLAGRRVNGFRLTQLGLESLESTVTPNLLARAAVPATYFL